MPAHARYLEKVVLSLLGRDTVFSKGSLDGSKFQQDLDCLSSVTQLTQLCCRTGQVLWTRIKWPSKNCHHIIKHLYISRNWLVSGIKSHLWKYCNNFFIARVVIYKIVMISHSRYRHTNCLLIIHALQAIIRSLWACSCFLKWGSLTTWPDSRVPNLKKPK